MSYELEGARERKRNNEAKAKELYDKVKREEQEVRDLQRQLSEAEKQNSDLKAQKEDLDSKMKALSGRLDATDRILANLRSQISTKKQGIDRDQAEMDKFQESVVRLDREIGELMRRR